MRFQLVGQLFRRGKIAKAWQTAAQQPTKTDQPMSSRGHNISSLWMPADGGEGASLTIQAQVRNDAYSNFAAARTPE